MIDLPRALAPWGAELAAFPADVALALGRVAGRLSAAMGPMVLPASRAGEPDGFDGIARRGSYARLLAGEWALADEVPDEFLRRAATGELAFFRTRHREPALGRAAFALFDAGPDQLGAPRIAQLGALVVLAQRARAARAPLRWGIVQAPAAGWIDDVTPASVRRLLEARTRVPPSAAHLEAWSALLRAEARAAGEIWLVGGGGLGALARALDPVLRASTVTVDDPLEPEGAALHVTCARFRGAAARVVLELPERPMAVRLLRDPYATATARAQVSPAVGAGARVVLPSAQRAIVLRADGTLAAFPVPSSPLAAPGRSATFAPPQGEVVVASEWRAGRWLVVTQRRDEFLLHTLGNRGGVVRPPSVFTSRMMPRHPLPASPSVLMPLVVRHDGVASFVHPAGVGVELRGERIVVTGVAAAVARCGKGPVWARQDDDARWIERSGHRREVDRSGDGRTFFGYGAPGAKEQEASWIAAVRVGDTTWKAYTETTSITLNAPARAQVVGVTNSPALVLLEADPRSLTLLGLSFAYTLPALSAPVADAAVCSSAPVVACISATGELLVYSLKDQAVLLRVLPSSVEATP